MANAYLDWDSKQHWQMALNAAGREKLFELSIFNSFFFFISLNGWF